MDRSSPGKPGSSNYNSESMELDNELTNKFLSGEMSFSEYSNEWYSQDDEDLDDNNKSDDEPQQSIQRIDKGAIRRRNLRLSAALLGLMGEANLRFVRGDVETAEKMCHEIIKQVPNAPEPYQTLAQIYEHDPEKSLQFNLLAAHLGPSDANEWLRIAALLKEKKDVRQEMVCYSQAIKADPQNLDIHLKRLELLQTLEGTKYPLTNVNVSRVKCYHKIVTSMPESAGEIIMKYTRLATTLYHNNQEIERALAVMAVAYKKCPTQFNLEDINIFLELLMARKQYQTCIEIFISNLGLDIEAEIQTVKNTEGVIEEQTNYLQCSMSQDLPIDLKSKIVICFIHLGSDNLVLTLLNDFLQNDVEKAGDLYMDIEEALSSVGQHELSLRLLEPLVKSNVFDMGAVWLKHAECLHNLGRESDAIASYYRVLKQAPQHPDARRKLFSLLEKKGCIDEALDVLHQNPKFVVSASLLHEECTALKKYGRMLKYLKAGEALLSKTFVRYRHQEELKIAFIMKGGIDLIHNFRISRGENPYHEDDIHFAEDETFKLTPSKEWDFYKELLGVACEHKQYFTMQRLSYGAMMSKSLTSHRLNIEFDCLKACLLAKDYQNAFRLIKEITVKNPSNRSWNLLNLVTHFIEENSHIKFLTRLFQREQYVVKSLFLGNNFLNSGRYLVGLKYFLEYYDQHRDPLSALLVAITILVMAAQRTVDKHNNLILQGLSYLFTYQNLRKCDMETNYNLGRAYQMLCINNLAIEYYERALSCEPIAECPQHGTINLTKEIAYNLHLLYKDNSPEMARKYILKYLVI